ncbi:hypothetical protein B0T20DRAFT_345706 [Sordaria brevicollis]|uniref:DNA repair protein Crb2 Tudor domain-containing protein n=1 Tax=Sordaria brevicollis TaxID=83679 RepID=A0AAE0PLP8_SORBR|nr:hypothetical protein B0T20DRAFT_345706 [Sordaria brevicollis]
MAAQLEAERKEYETQLELVDASLQDDPENEELLALRTELTNCIQLLNDSLAELKGASTTAAAAPQEPLAIGIPTSSSTSHQQQRKPPSVQLDLPTPATEEPPKWSRENHPAFKKQPSQQQETSAKDDAATPVPVANFQVNDTVMARWLSGDKGFYPAKIVSVTGSHTAPIYTVKFKSYDTVETLRAKDVKPVAAPPAAPATAASTSTGGTGAGFKRKADFSDSPSIPAGSAAGAAAITRNSDGITLSAGPELYPGALAAAQAAGQEKKDGKFDKDGKPKFKKIKANKELEKGKNKWQEFTQKAAGGKLGKVAKKESMFRTPEGIHGRVGFTGSGQAMRKDPTRSRHIYQPNEDLD